MQENKQQIIGSSTACLMMLSHSGAEMNWKSGSNKYFFTLKYFSPDLKLYTTNIGDSGFLVVRRGEVVHRWVELSEQKMLAVNVKIF